MEKRHRRFNLEYRADDDSGSMSVMGTAIRFGDIAELPWGKERIEPGALQFDDVILNRGHDRALPLARTGGGGLILEMDSDSLRFKAKMPDTSISRDTMTMIENSLLRGASLEFMVNESRFEDDMEVISRGEVVGIGLVDRPAYPQSEIETMARHWMESAEKKGKKIFVV